MRYILIIFIFCFSTSTYSQIIKEIYRLENRPESPAVATYNVSILILYMNGDYKLMHQEYRSKKMMKKNVILDMTNEYGKWIRIVDKLHLTDSKNNKTHEFFFDENKIALIMNGGEVSPLYWKKVN